MEKETVLIVCLIMFGVGGLLVTRGITGMYYSVENYVAVCTQDSECSFPNVCCDFFGESYGVCDSSGSCPAIAMATKQEKEQFSSLNPPTPNIQKTLLVNTVSSHLETPKANYNRNSVIVGFLLIASALIVYFLTSRSMKTSRGKTARSKRLIRHSRP